MHLAQPADLYDLVAGAFVARDAKSGDRLTLAPNQALVLVQVPLASKIECQATQLVAGGVVIDYRMLLRRNQDLSELLLQKGSEVPVQNQLAQATN